MDAANKGEFETTSGRGVYTTQDPLKGQQYAQPTLVNKHLVKTVLLLAIPGDMSDRGVSVNFKPSVTWCGQQKLPSFVRIPKHIVTDACIKAWPEDEETIMEKGLHRWSYDKSQEVKIEEHCTEINEQMNTGKWTTYEQYEKRNSKQKMVTECQEGQSSEEPWTSMNLDGLECQSSRVHVVGFFVGYMGGSNIRVTPSRKGAVTIDFDETLLPAAMRVRDGEYSPSSRPASLLAALSSQAEQEEHEV